MAFLPLLPAMRAPRAPRPAASGLCGTRTRPAHTPAAAPRGKGGKGFGKEGVAAPSTASTLPDAAPSPPAPPAHVYPNNTMPTRQEGRADATAVADRLLAVFASRDPATWRGLIAASAEWTRLCPAVLARADALASAAGDPADRAAARRLARRLRAVSDELKSYDAELARYLKADPGQWEGMVAGGRDALPAAFFEHAAARARAARLASAAGTPIPDLPPPPDLAAAVTRLGALAAGVDVASADPAAAAAAAAEFHALLGEPDSLEAAESRIDDLAASGRLDPAFMMTAAKAYAAASESPYTRDEAKEVMYKLWRKAQASFSAAQPPEVRILKYLLTLPGEVDVRSALNDAFTPGAGPRGGEASGAPAGEPRQWLSTTPPALLAKVDAVLTAYEAAPIRGGAGAAKARKALERLNPTVVGRLKGLRAMISREWM